MTDEIKKFDYQYIVIEDGASQTAGILNSLAAAGVNLVAVSEFPNGPGKWQLDLITEDTEDAEALVKTARDMGLSLSQRKSGLLVRGRNRPSAVAEILTRLADNSIKVTAVQALSAGAGRFGALIWVKPEDVAKAAAALGVSAYHNSPPYDVVDESSIESFPASDAPSWAA
jgi:hypothetical protein